MKKLIIFICLAAGCILLDLGCIAVFERPVFALKADDDSVHQKYMGLFYDVVDCFESGVHLVKKGSKFACPVEEFTIPAPMVQIDGITYIQTGRVNELVKCGVLDGEIESSVSESEIPRQNNQSNFGSGYGYQFGTEGTVEVNIDGQWHLFASEDKFDELVLDLSNYQKVSDLPQVKDADVQILFSIHGKLYAKSYAMIDYAGSSNDPSGMIRYVIPEDYVPWIDEETNCEELLGALIYDESETSAILYYENVYYYFVKIQ